MKSGRWIAVLVFLPLAALAESGSHTPGQASANSPEQQPPSATTMLKEHLARLSAEADSCRLAETGDARGAYSENISRLLLKLLLEEQGATGPEPRTASEAMVA